MTSIINYEDLYIETLAHYLAEIYFINQIIKEDKIKEYTDKINKKLRGYDRLIKLIKNKDFKKFKIDIDASLGSFH